MSIPELIWLVSWSVCGLALIILIGLVAWRVWANRRADARRREREQYIELLKARAERPVDAPLVDAGDVLTDLSVEILELVRGDEKPRFAESMAGAGATGRLHARLRRGDARTRILAAAALANFGDEETQGGAHRGARRPQPGSAADGGALAGRGRTSADRRRK